MSDRVIVYENTRPSSHGYTNKFWNECPVCQGQRNRRTSELTAVAVRALKAALEEGHESNARRALHELRELGHPDITGLEMAVRGRLARLAEKSSGSVKGKWPPSGKP